MNMTKKWRENAGGTKIAINVFLFVCTLVFLVYLLICLFVRLVCICANPIKIRACSFGLEIIVIILITPSESIFKIIRPEKRPEFQHFSYLSKNVLSCFTLSLRDFKLFVTS